MYFVQFVSGKNLHDICEAFRSPFSFPQVREVRGGTGLFASVFVHFLFHFIERFRHRGKWFNKYHFRKSYDGFAGAIGEDVR